MVNPEEIKLTKLLHAYTKDPDTGERKTVVLWQFIYRNRIGRINAAYDNWIYEDGIDAHAEEIMRHDAQKIAANGIETNAIDSQVLTN